MGYISWDYRCEECDHIETHLMRRGEESDYVYCEEGECNGQCYRLYGGHPSTRTSASIPDGTNKRFSHLRHNLAVKRAAAEAKEKGDASESKRLLAKEIRKK